MNDLKRGNDVNILDFMDITFKCKLHINEDKLGHTSLNRPMFHLNYLVTLILIYGY